MVCTLLAGISSGYLLTGQVMAQSAYALDDCVDYALSNSPVIEREMLKQQRSKAEYSEQTVQFLPEIHGYMRYQHYFSDLPVYLFPEAEGAVLSGGAADGFYPVELGLPHNMNAGLSLEQVIFDNRLFLLSRLKPEMDKLEELSMTQVRNELVFNVATGYYRVGMLRNKMEVIDYNLSRLERLSDMVALQVRNDFADEAELLRLQVRTSKLRTDRQKLENGIMVQKNYLRLMMGLEHDAPFELVMPEQVQMHSIGDTASRNLERRVLEQQLVMLDLNRQRIRSKGMPSLNLFARINFQAQRPSWNFFNGSEPWYNIHFWGMSLDIPVMQGLSKKRELQLAQVRSEELQLGLDQSRKKHAIELDQARMEVASSMQTLEDERAHLAVAQKLFDQAELKFQEGTMMLRDYLDAEALLAETRINVVSQQYQLVLATLSLMKMKGNLADQLTED